jgi:putative transcriptional regulator
MMVSTIAARHHPGEEVLLSYATGDLAEPMALAVATHMALCPVCRVEVDRLEALGGVLLERLGLETGNLTSLQGAIDAAITRAARLPQELLVDKPARRAAPVSDRLFPQPLLDYVGGGLDQVAWRALAPGIRQAIIARNDAGASARLLSIAPGRGVLEHTHHGNEMTLVLQGSYTSGGEQFRRGDLEQADPDVMHRPVAGGEATCICLAVTDAPLRFNNVVGRLLQPLFGI